MTKDEALNLALEALEEINKLSVGENAICLPAEIDTAMDACRKVLAQPEQNQFKPDWDAMAVMVEEQQRMAKRIAELEAAPPVLTSDTSQDRVDETVKHRHEKEPVIDKSAAIRIATSLGWEPKRTWVGLTDEEISDLWDEVVKYAPSEVRIKEFARAIEAKLKEKNNG